jgi:hypothetical protein
VHLKQSINKIKCSIPHLAYKKEKERRGKRKEKMREEKRKSNDT